MPPKAREDEGTDETGTTPPVGATETVPGQVAPEGDPNRHGQVTTGGNVGERAPAQSSLAAGNVVMRPEESLTPAGDTTTEAAKVTVPTKPIEGSETFLEVTEDVVQEFYAPGSKRPSHRLVVAKGQHVTKDQVAALEA